MKLGTLLPLVTLATAAVAGMAAAQKAPEPRRGDRLLADYFRAETAALESQCLTEVKTLEAWTSRREEYRRQLQEMLGLWPLPERADLRARTTGRVEQPEFTVENITFQSRPGLYVTGNLYLPKGLDKPAPAVLYVCGHGNVKKDGISYGAKTSYQHHGAWLARNGYVCLTIDTLQLGEIEGTHHGTYREGMWWWNSCGYTPGGVEAWNGIRALDYLQSRPEVDRERLGVTGRSGGGAYSWYLAALDERIKVAVPVAGITDLHNHVVDGAVEGHCDCMFFVNTYRWDYPQLAALVAPRPLLFSNTDKDTIFPLEGIVRTHAKVRNIYRLYKAEDKLGLLITEGPHKDTQELQVPALHWLNRYLKGEDPLIENTAVKLLEPEKLRVFTALPKDERNTKIHETFVPAAPLPTLPASAAAFTTRREELLAQLREKTFRGWPTEGAPLNLKQVFTAQRDGIRLTAYDFTSQEHVPLRLYVAQRAGAGRPELTVLNPVDAQAWSDWLASMRPGFEAELQEETLPAADPDAWAENQAMFKQFNWAMAYVAPRGIGLTAWDPDPRKQTMIRRRFMLLGQTLDGMRVWDVRRAVQAARAVDSLKGVPLWLQGERGMAVEALYASLFEPDVARLDLWELPLSHREGPDFLNVLKFTDVPEVVALAAEHSRVRLYHNEGSRWTYPISVGKRLGWDPKQVEIRALPAAGK